MAERVAEFDLANERVLLATMAKDPSVRRRLVRDLTSDEFGDERHRVMFRALQGMDRAGLAWSEDTLSEMAGGEDFGGWEYLRAILADYEPNRNVDYHVDRLRLEALKYRVLGDDVPAIAQVCEDPKAPPEALAAPLRTALNRVVKRTHRFTHGGGELVDGYYSTLRTRSIVGGVVHGTGWPILDGVLTRGFAPRTISVVAGRPGHGKSTWLANLLRHRLREREGVFVCAWEMDPEDFVDAMISAETGIPHADLALRVRSMPSAQKALVRDAAERLRDKDLIEFQEIPFPHLPKPQSRWDVNERNLDHFEATVEDASRTKSLVAVDVFNKLLSDRRPDSVADALARIRGMAKRYAVHIMLIHHLNRDAAEGRPTLEGLKGSGAFEEEADLIFGLDRPIMRASPARRKKMRDVLDVHLLKQRKGPAPVCVRYRYDGARFLITGETEVDLAMLEQEDDHEEDEA